MLFSFQVIVSALISAAVVSYLVHQRHFHPLAKVPGPYLASLTKLWLAYKTWQGQIHKVHLALHQKYGPIVRIAPNELSFYSLNALKSIYGASNGFEKSDFYRE